MNKKLVGQINQKTQSLRGKINQISQTVEGKLNIYTMETGDGRDIELTVIDDYICWRRVNDIQWIKLVPLSAISPVKGVDYWTDEDIALIVDYVEQAIGGDISHNNLVNRDYPDAHPISSITGLEDILNKKIPDKNYVHLQKFASDSWNIIHNLNKYPSITIVDSANNTVLGDISYISLNEVNIKFIGAFSGKAFLN